MKLSQQAIAIIRADKRLKVRLAMALDKSGSTIYRVLDENKEDAILTTATALKVIREATGLADSEILVEVKEAVAA